MEKVLVYGASGDQGVPLVNSLIKNGYKIRAASRYPENYNSEIEGDVESVKADLFDIHTLKKASQDVYCIAMNLHFVFDRDNAKQIEMINEKYHFDKPIYKQYFYYLNDL